MATIEKRLTPNGKLSFRVKVRLKGARPISEKFNRLTDAKRWAQSTEAAIRDGRHFKDAAAKKHTVGELVDKYISDILPDKPRNARVYKQQLLWWKQELGHLTLDRLTPAEIASRRDMLRGRKVRSGGAMAPATVVRYLSALSVALSTAVKEWEWLDDTPMRKVRKPKEPRGRVRRLDKAEILNLLACCKESKSPHL